MIRTTREITDAFEAEGFDVELVDEGGGMPERERDRPSAGDGTDTFRMRLVARSQPASCLRKISPLLRKRGTDTVASPRGCARVGVPETFVEGDIAA